MSFFYYIYILKPTIFLENKKNAKNEAKRNHQTECTAEQSFVQKNCKKRTADHVRMILQKQTTSRKEECS